MPGRRNERKAERGCRGEKKKAVGVKLSLGGQRENAEFFELRASTYQGFFETKKKEGQGALVDCSGQRRRTVLSRLNGLRSQ